ncbi:hypothetical protein JJT62_17560 [Methylocystis sp. Sn-Cys]|nr:hypothetical protein [Methylocystis sp. Sn-Cys]
MRSIKNELTCADSPTWNGSTFMFPAAMRALPSICLLALLCATSAYLGQAHAVEGQAGDRPFADRENGQDYCSSVAKAASTAKMAAQETRLRELESLIKRRGEELEAKKRELEAVLEKYEALLKRADENLVTVYSKMKPDVAAAQFAVLDDDVAIALLSRLNPKASSQILSEMTASRGAGLIKKLAAYSSAKSSGKPQ